ncbi:MAG: 4Fe-4S dicluster domain-containing protein [Phycisphaerae bacterium]|nr:4Fe-4S dicluster domain-containing protein [Phycisphaerae bacterium]
MGLRRYGTFIGGIDLPDQKSATLNRPITPATRPSRLLVPLNPCGGPPAQPVVTAGQTVQADQKLAEAHDPTAVDVFAPLSGRVASVAASAAVAGPTGFMTVPAIELVDLDQAPPSAALRPRAHWLHRDADALAAEVCAGALTTHRRPIVPLTAWLDRAARCDVLIANGFEGQPYVTASHRLLTEYGADVIVGLAILARVLRSKRVMLAVDHRRTGSYHELARAARRHGIVTIALPHKYPTGADALLVKVLTRRRVPPGGRAADAGVATIDPASCLEVFRWVACGLRPTGRVVTVSGERASPCENYWTPLGYPCAELIGGVQPFLHGGPMVALRGVAGAVVTAATDALLAIDEAPLAVPTPCIRCGWCTDHCPARLNVAILNDDFELAQVDHAHRLGVEACLACGVCSYVCPARLPLAARVGRLKQAVSGAEGPAR